MCVRATDHVHACYRFSPASPAIFSAEGDFRCPPIVALDPNDPGIGEPAQSAVLGKAVNPQLGQQAAVGNHHGATAADHT